MSETKEQKIERKIESLKKEIRSIKEYKKTLKENRTIELAETRIMQLKRELKEMDGKQ